LIKPIFQPQGYGSLWGGKGLPKVKILYWGLAHGNILIAENFNEYKDHHGVHYARRINKT